MVSVASLVSMVGVVTVDLGDSQIRHECRQFLTAEPLTPFLPNIVSLVRPPNSGEIRFELASGNVWIRPRHPAENTARRVCRAHLVLFGGLGKGVSPERNSA